MGYLNTVIYQSVFQYYFGALLSTNGLYEKLPRLFWIELFRLQSREKFWKIFYFTKICVVLLSLKKNTNEQSIEKNSLR